MTPKFSPPPQDDLGTPSAVSVLSSPVPTATPEPRSLAEQAASTASAQGRGGVKDYLEADGEPQEPASTQGKGPAWEMEVLRPITAIEPSRQDPNRPWATAYYKVDGPEGQGTEIPCNEDILVLKGDGRKIHVPAFAAVQVMGLHLHGEREGSQLARPLEDSFAMVAQALPENLPYQDGVAAFSIDLGQYTGMEGVASQQEMLDKGVMTPDDVQKLDNVKNEVFLLNLVATVEERKAFVERFNTQMTGNAQLGVRGDAIVPFFTHPKQPTNQMFMVVAEGKGELPEGLLRYATVITMAPGRYMDKLPTDRSFLPLDTPAKGEAQAKAQDYWWNSGFLVEPAAI
jgi:hypothetical protein